MNTQEVDSTRNFMQDKFVEVVNQLLTSQTSASTTKSPVKKTRKPAEKEKAPRSTSGWQAFCLQFIRNNDSVFPDSSDVRLTPSQRMSVAGAVWRTLEKPEKDKWAEYAKNEEATCPKLPTLEEMLIASQASDVCKNNGAIETLKNLIDKTKKKSPVGAKKKTEKKTEEAVDEVEEVEKDDDD
jgi:hypothetical protein